MNIDIHRLKYAGVLMPFGIEHPLSGPGTAPDVHPGALEVMRQIRRWTLPDPQPVEAVLIDAWFLIDGGGLPIVTPPTTRAYGRCDFPARITGAWLLADQVGDVTVDVLSSTFDDFPAFTSITGGSPLVLSGAQKQENIDLLGSGWSTLVNRGTIFRVDISGPVSIQLLLVALRLKRLDLNAPD